MKRLFVLGNYGYVTNKLDGQTIKTREIYSLLKRNASDCNVTYFDTQYLKVSKLYLLKMLWKLLAADDVVYLAGRNNINRFFKFLFFVASLCNKKIIYPVVGGWLPEFIKGKDDFIKKFAKVDAILVETSSMKRKLEEYYSFDNVSLFPNFRISEYIPQFRRNDKLRVVFMARISSAKGCELVFDYADFCKDNNVKDVEICFYGQIETGYENDFRKRLRQFDFVSYEGVVEPSDVFDTLGAYDVLVLPTHYEGEGFPGSVVEAYMAGIPAIVSDWKDLSEVVEDGKSGFVFDLASPDEFNTALEKLRCDKELLQEMKKNAFELSEKYSERHAWRIIKEFL